VSKDTQRRDVAAGGVVAIDPSVLEALQRLLEVMERSQASLIEDAARRASQISNNFDEQLRLDPAFLHEQITL